MLLLHLMGYSLDDSKSNSIASCPCLVVQRMLVRPESLPGNVESTVLIHLSFYPCEHTVHFDIQYHSYTIPRNSPIDFESFREQLVAPDVHLCTASLLRSAVAARDVQHSFRTANHEPVSPLSSALSFFFRCGNWIAKTNALTITNMAIAEMKTRRKLWTYASITTCR